MASALLLPAIAAAAVYLCASSASAITLDGNITYLTFAEGTYDVQLGLIDLVTAATTPVYTFDSETFESGFWVESSFVTQTGTWVSNVQYDANNTQGYLLEYNFASQQLTGVNATYCWAMFTDVRDSSGNTVLCVADDAMDVSTSGSRSRRARHVRGATRKTPAARALDLAAAASAPVKSGLVRQVFVYSIDRTTGEQATLGAFPVDEEEAIDVTYDSKRGIIWAMLMNDASNANSLFGFNVSSGSLLPNPAPIVWNQLMYCFEYDAATDTIYAMASTWNASVSAWNTFFGNLDPATGQLNPIGPVNGTFAFFRQFNDIDVVVPAQGVYFSTMFDWTLPDTTLYLVGVSVADGRIVYQQAVRNPFIDIDYLPPGTSLSQKQQQRQPRK